VVTQTFVKLREFKVANLEELIFNKVTLRMRMACCGFFSLWRKWAWVMHSMDELCGQMK